MGKILIVNGSPRAPKSNSKQFAELFSKACSIETAYFNISKMNHESICHALESCTDVLFVFPLYADGVPVTLLQFLNTLEHFQIRQKPVVSVLINCGFMEPHQNDVAVEIMQCFCEKNGYSFGSVFKIGSGEAILATPFKWLVYAKIKRFAASIVSKKYRTFCVTMPISKKMFLKASTVYWENYGKKNGVTKEQMATMQIEKD